MSRTFVAAASLIVLSTALCACQTTSVVSTDPSDNPTSGGRYVVYPLATTLFTVTVKKAPADATSPAAGAAPANSNVTTVTVQTASPAAGATDDKTSASKASAGVDPCDDLRSAYNTSVEDLWKATAAHDSRVAQLKALAKGPLKTLAQQDAATKIVTDELAAAKKAADTQTAGATTAAAYRMGACEAPIEFDISRTVVPSTTSRTLYIGDDRFSNDSVTLKFDANGLPIQLSSSADEKSGDVAVGIAQSIGTIVGLSTNVPAAAVPGPVGPPALETHDLKIPGILSPQALPAGKTKKPRKPMPAAAFGIWLSAQIARITAPTTPILPPLDPKLPKNPLVIAVDDVDDSNEAMQSYANHIVKVSCSPLPQKPEDANTPGRLDGFAVSFRRACRVSVTKPAAGGASGLVVRGDFSAPDPRRVTLLPVSRSTLIARTNSYDFVDGEPTGVSYDKPSDALQAATLLPNVVAGFVSGLSTAVQGQQSLLTAKANLVAAQANAKAAGVNADATYVQAQTALVQAQTALAQAKAAAAAAPAVAAPASQP